MDLEEALDWSSAHQLVIISDEYIITYLQLTYYQGIKPFVCSRFGGEVNGGPDRGPIRSRTRSHLPWLGRWKEKQVDSCAMSLINHNKYF